ncbi:Hypothetical protein KVN_LOCUS70 [uncultured virus]|nr:Hypothetical protein KVN_LOCUS70 [uncultured virus]
MSYDKEIIKEAQIINRKANGLIGNFGFKHFGLIVTTIDNNKYLIHSTPDTGTCITNCTLSNKWKIMENINIIGTKSVGETFRYVSGHTNNKLINYISSGTCIFTAIRGKSFLESKEKSNDDQKGGIRMTKFISIVGNLDFSNIQIKLLNNRINIYKKPTNKNLINLINGKYQNFDINIFNSCILMNMNGKTLNFSVSLDPTHNIDKSNILSSKLKLRLFPSMILEERSCGAILLESDLVFKKLLTGSFEEQILIKLKQIGYKSFLEYRMEIFKENINLRKNYSPLIGKIWLEVTKMSILIDNDLIYPQIEYQINFMDESNQILDSDIKFTKWISDNFDKLSEIFPVLRNLDELFHCYLTVCYLKKNAELIMFENIAFNMEKMHEYKNKIFDPKYFNCSTKILDEIYENKKLQIGVYGGITNPFLINDKSQYIHFNIKTEKIKIDPESKIKITISDFTLYKIEYGFEVNLQNNSKIKDIYNSIHDHLKYVPEEWLELCIFSEILLEKETDLLSLGFESGENYEMILNINIKLPTNYQYPIYNF